MTDTDDITNRQLLDAMTQQLGVITDNMVTKKDLQNELKRFATKDDLKRFATKDDLKSAEARLQRSIRSSHSINVGHHLETRSMIGDLYRETKSLRESSPFSKAD